jgi:hypothetical protein
MLLEPAAAAMVPPPQEPVSPFGVATKRPEGNGSVKLTFVNEAAMLFVILNVNPMVWCCKTVGAANDLVNNVAGGVTVTWLEAGVPGPLSLEVGALEVLVNTPVAAPLATTSIAMKQGAGAIGRETPTTLNNPDPGTAVTVPLPHELNILFGVATTNPVGIVSVKPTPVRGPKVGKPGSPALGLET